MAFPTTTTVLDDFNRASLGSNWTVIGGAGLNTTGSTQLYWGGAAAGDTYSAAQFGPDLHFYITLAAGTTSGELTFNFFHDLTGGSSGYVIDYDGGTSTLLIQKRTAGTSVTMTTGNSVTFAAGDEIGVGIEGNVITVYKNAGTWTQILQATDSTSPFTGVQRWLQIFIWTASWRLDDMVLATVTPATHFVRYRIGKNVSSGTLNFTVSLMQGATQIAQWTHSNVSNTMTTYEQALTSGQISSITDTTDLRLRFVTS